MRPSRVEAIEREQIEAHRSERREPRIIEDSAHDMDPATRSDGSTNIPECQERVRRGQHLQEGAHDGHVILFWESLVHDISSHDFDTISGSRLGDEPLRDGGDGW